MNAKNKKMITLTKKEDVIITWDNREVEPNLCVRINGQWYEKDVDCFYVEVSPGRFRWNRKDNGRIAFNYEKDKWDLIKNLRDNIELELGIYNEKGDKGYFLLNPYKNVILNEEISNNDTAGTLCLNGDVANKLGYVEYIPTGIYVNSKNIPKSTNINKKALLPYRKIKRLSYNADENNQSFLETIQHFKRTKSKIPLSLNSTGASKLLDNKSWGLEMESSNGTVPFNLLGPLGLVPLKDGSLRNNLGEPFEYTTIPLSGEHGLEVIKLICEELTKRCEFDKKCSLHVHIGGIKNRTEEFVIAMYKLCYNLQDEIFEMFPDYKRAPEKYIEDFNKNYCQKLPDLNLNQFDFKQKLSHTDAKALVKKAFDSIYWFLSDQTVNCTNSEFNLHSFRHPKGTADKWHFHARYFHVNLMRYMFNRSETIEFRLSTATFNHTKIINWLFICAGIVQFAEQFTNEILRDEVPYTLDTILDCYKNNFFKSFCESDYNLQVANYLKAYVGFRKNEMHKCLEKGDGFGKSIEFKNDAKFSFEHNGMRDIF